MTISFVPQILSDTVNTGSNRVTSSPPADGAPKQKSGTDKDFETTFKRSSENSTVDRDAVDAERNSKGDHEVTEGHDAPPEEAAPNHQETSDDQAETDEAQHNIVDGTLVKKVAITEAPDEPTKVAAAERIGTAAMQAVNSESESEVATRSEKRSSTRTWATDLQSSPSASPREEAGDRRTVEAGVGTRRSPSDIAEKPQQRQPPQTTIGHDVVSRSEGTTKVDRDVPMALSLPVEEGAKEAPSSLLQMQTMNKRTPFLGARDIVQRGGDPQKASRVAGLSLRDLAERAHTETQNKPEKVTQKQTNANAVLANMVPANPATSQLFSHVSQITSKRDNLALQLDGEIEKLRFDLPSVSTVSGVQSAQSTSVLSRPEIPRMIAFQLAEAVRGSADRTIDLALSPKELGQVRLSISAAEGGVTMNVLAERPETLDLLKRHSEILANHLAHLGFSSVDLTFGQGGNFGTGDARAENAEGGERPDPDHANDEPQAAQASPRAYLNMSSGLDIRV